MKRLFLICLLAVSLCGAVAAQTPVITNFVNQNTGMPFVDGSTVNLGETVTVTAVANADTHSVVFSKDGVTMKVDVTDPYSFTWAPPALGAHILAARPWNGPNGTGISGPATLVHYNVINATQTPTPTPTPTGTPTPSPIPTQSPTPTTTPTPTGTPTPTISPTGTPTPTPSGSPTPSPTPTGTPSSTPIPTPTPIGGTKVVTFAWSGTADTLWYGAKSEAVVQNYTGVICAPATTCTGTAFPLSHSLVLPVGVQTVKVSFATGQHYFVVVSNAGGNSNLIEFDL